MNDGLREEIARICNKAYYCDTGNLISWDDLTDFERGVAFGDATQIHAIYLKHGYGQRDDKAELPIIPEELDPPISKSEVTAYGHYYAGWNNGLNKAKRDGWHKDVECPKIESSAKGKNDDT